MRVSSSPTSSSQNPSAIIERYLFSLSNGPLTDFYRLHHPITAICIYFTMLFHPALGFLCASLLLHCFTLLYFLPSQHLILLPFSYFSLIHFFITFFFIHLTLFLFHCSYYAMARTKTTGASPPTLVHSLSQVHPLHLRLLRPLRQAHSLTGYTRITTTLGCMSGHLWPCWLKRQCNSPTITSQPS